MADDVEQKFRRFCHSRSRQQGAGDGKTASSGSQEFFHFISTNESERQRAGKPCWEQDQSSSSEARLPLSVPAEEGLESILRRLCRVPFLMLQKMTHLVPIRRSRLNYRPTAGTFPPNPHLPLFTTKIIPKVTSNRAESMPNK